MSIKNTSDFVTNIAGNNRFLFMPHSPANYVALVLKNASSLEEEASQTDSFSELNLSSQGTVKSLNYEKKEKVQPVSRHFINNNLFLDLSSLSKSFQTILKQYQMLVVAKVKAIHRCIVTPESENVYDLENGTVYF